MFKYTCTDACIQHQLIYMILGLNLLHVFNIWQNVDLNKIAIAIAYKHFLYIFLSQKVSNIALLGHNAEPILILSEYLQLFALRNFQLRRIYLMGTIPMQQKLGATQAFEITMEKICCCPLYLEVKYMLCPLPPLSKYLSVLYTRE